MPVPEPTHRSSLTLNLFDPGQIGSSGPNDALLNMATARLAASALVYVILAVVDVDVDVHAMDEESTWLLSIGPASVKTAHRSCCEIVGPRFWMRIVRIGLGWVAVGVGVCTGVSVGVDVPVPVPVPVPVAVAAAAAAG